MKLKKLVEDFLGMIKENPESKIRIFKRGRKNKINVFIRELNNIQ